MKICLTSFAAPWFFGPYGQQLRILAEELYKKKYEIYFLVLDMDLPLDVYNYSTVRSFDKGKNNISINENIWKNIKFLGGVKKLNNKILTSNLKNCNFYTDEINQLKENIKNLNQRIKIDKINFCIKTKYLNLIDKNINGKYLNKALFVNFSSNLKTAIADQILCREI